MHISFNTNIKQLRLQRWNEEEVLLSKIIQSCTWMTANANQRWESAFTFKCSFNLPNTNGSLQPICEYGHCTGFMVQVPCVCSLVSCSPHIKMWGEETCIVYFVQLDPPLSKWTKCTYVQQKKRRDVKHEEKKQKWIVFKPHSVKSSVLVWTLMLCLPLLNKYRALPFQ